MAKKLLRIKLENLFYAVHTSSYWEKVKKLPLILRYFVGTLLVLFGLLGMITPIPAGIVFFLIGIALMIGLKRVKSGVFSIIHTLRLHILYGKIYTWWHERKKTPIE
jgi:hypothetical protein